VSVGVRVGVGVGVAVGRGVAVEVMVGVGKDVILGAGAIQFGSVVKNNSARIMMACFSFIVPSTEPHFDKIVAAQPLVPALNSGNP